MSRHVLFFSDERVDTFETPTYERVQSHASLHECWLKALSQTEAEQMADDFLTYQYQCETASARPKVYRYDPRDAERRVALDFEEVGAIATSDMGSE